MNPEELKKLLEELNKQADLLQDNFGNLAKVLAEPMLTKLQANVGEANKLIDAFEKGEDVTRKLSNKLTSLQKESNKLSVQQLRLDHLLEKAKLRGNNVVAERLKNSILQNKIAQTEIEKQQTLLVKLNNAAEANKKATEEKKKQTTLAGFLETKYKNITESLSKGAIQLFIFKAILDSAFRFSKVSTDIGKNLGYGADNANRTAANLVKVAQGASNTNITLQNAAEAMNELSTSTGFVAEYSADALETQIMLTKQFGLQADEAAGIYKLSVLTGKSSKAVNDAMVGAYVATRNQLRVGVPFKAAIAEASKVSGQLAANLQNNPEQIVKAVVQAKALGTTLEQVKNQGESLLNFETSIENELKAELLTGKQLNLERARAAALTGDQVALAEELNKNVGSLEDFQKMNVIQQKTLAEAVGLTADQLAEQLRKQKLAAESGKSLAQITEEEAKQAQERQNAQDKFNLAVTKLQDLIGNLVAGPFGQLLDMVSSIANIILKIIKPFVNIAGAILNPILKGISGTLGAITGDDIVGYGARTLITPQGAVALNNNDTVIAGTNLFKGDDVMSFPKGALGFGPVSDVTFKIDVVKAIKDLQQTLIDRPAQAFIQGENAFVSRVTTKGVQSTYKSA